MFLAKQQPKNHTHQLDRPSFTQDSHQLGSPSCQKNIIHIHPGVDCILGEGRWSNTPTLMVQKSQNITSWGWYFIPLVTGFISPRWFRISEPSIIQFSTSSWHHNTIGASKFQSPSISVQRNSSLPQLDFWKVGFCTIFFTATGLLFLVVPSWWNLTYPVKSHFGDSKLTPWKRTYPVKLDGWFRWNIPLKWFVRGHSLIFGVIFSCLISPKILCWCFNFLVGHLFDQTSISEKNNTKNWVRKLVGCFNSFEKNARQIGSWNPR